MAISTQVNNNLYKRALSEADKQRLAQIAQTQGAAAASSAYLASQNATQGATTPPAPTPGTGGATVTPTSDAAAARERAQAAQQQMQASQERARVLSSGDTKAINEYLQKEAQQRAIEQAAKSGNTQAAAQMQQAMNAEERARILSSGNQQQINQYLIEQSRQQAGQNAYQKAVASATPATSGHGLSNAPTINGNYIWYGWMGDNDMTTMNDEDKANWQKAMAGWNKGDYTAYNEGFQTNGNWASYVDDNGNVSGMLRYVGDGVGGYAPVNQGQLLQNGYSGDLSKYAFYGPNGEVYTVGADGRLARTGTWTQEVPAARAENVYDRMLKGTATAEEIANATRQVDPLYDTKKAASAGDEEARATLEAYAASKTPAQQAIADYDRQTARETTATPTPTVTPQQAQQPTQQPQPAVTQTAQQQITPVTSQNTNNQNIYQAYMDQWDYPEAPEWEGTEYEKERDAALERAKNMRWNYDPNTDPVWQAYQKQYRREGDRATKEALAQASMRTGGLANSYAATAASQAGDYYASQLSDKLPELYQDAYNRYLQEFQRQLGISDQYEQQGQTEYNRYMDRLGQYNTDRNFDYGRYRDAVGDYRYDDETQYNRTYQAQRDAINDQRYDQEWAQQLREYADSQGWKQKEWEQYLREYGDQLSEKEKQWAYQMARDAVSDARYADETAYNRGKYEDETAYQRAMYDREYADEQDQNAWERGYKQTAYNDEMQRTALNYLNTNGIVTGRYAEILGVPDGTTYEQYYSRYLGGSTSPFEETEIDSGKPYSGGGYDESGGGDDKGGSTYTGSGKTINVDKNGNMDLSGENLDKAATNQATGTTLRHENGKTMTEGFRLWWPKIRRSYDDGASVQQIAQKISNLYEQGVIAEYEIDIILDELGIGTSGLNTKWRSR